MEVSIVSGSNQYQFSTHTTEDNQMRQKVYKINEFPLNWKNKKVKNDPVNHPKHYTAHPSGVECIQVTEHMNFCRGNAIKYVWRAGEKGNEVEDLKKARWYIDREIKRLTGEKK